MIEFVEKLELLIPLLLNFVKNSDGMYNTIKYVFEILPIFFFLSIFSYFRWNFGTFLTDDNIDEYIRYIQNNYIGFTFNYKYNLNIFSFYKDKFQVINA